MPAGGLVTAGVIGLGTTIYGIAQKRKAEKAAAANVMPTYTIPGEEQANLAIAQSQAGQGMSDASRAAYLNNAGAGLAATNNAILRGGGDANTIGSAYNKYETGINNQAIYDDQARMAHLSNLQSAYTRMSAQKDKQWQINQYQPWANKAQALGQQLTGAQNTISSGINTLGSAGMGIASHYMNAVKPLQPSGGQQRESIEPLSTGGYQGSYQPQQVALPNQPAFGNYGSGWNPPMAGGNRFSFPDYYPVDNQQ